MVIPQFPLSDRNRLQNLDKLSTEELEPEFVTEVSRVVKSILSTSPPKYIGSSLMTGLSFMKFLQECVEKLNDTKKEFFKRDIGRSSSQSGSSRRSAPRNLNISSKTESNYILLSLEEEGYTTPDEKVEQLITKLTKSKYLYALKLLFENLQNKFSSQILVDSLRSLANPTLFDHHSMEIVTRLELHLRTLVAALEQICFSQIVIGKEIRDKIYDSLTKFAEFHRKNIQVIEEGLVSGLKSKYNPSNQQDDIDNKGIEKHNYNIDFLLIHLRDTLHSLRDDEIWFQEILRRIKEFLKAVLNIAPGLTSIVAPGVALPNDNCSILSMLTQLRQGLSFKYPVASYYINWRIMLIIQHNLLNWSREWNSVADKTMLNSQTKFDEVSNKLFKTLRNAGGFLNNLAGNEPLALPNMLWFGILDLAQNLIQKSTQPVIQGLFYYLAIESLNKALSSFIQFKAIEILLHLQNINEELFSMVEIDFKQYAQKLYENNSNSESSERFQCLLSFVKEKCHQDLIMLNDDIGKGKGKCIDIDKNTYFRQEHTLNSRKIMDIIIDEMTFPISLGLEDQFYLLKCQHKISLNMYNKLTQKKCPICRESIENNDVKYVSQKTIYKHLYPCLEDQTNKQHEDDSEDDSGNSEVDQIIIKKMNLKEIKLKLDILQPKKLRPSYQNVINELANKNYEKAISIGQVYLRKFPNSYTMRCILAYACRCLNNYKQAHSYLDEAIIIKKSKPIAYFIRGEILFRQGDYFLSINELEKSKNQNNKLNIILGNCYLLERVYDAALESYEVALQNDSRNYLCLKYCAFIYEIQERYSEALEMLDKLLEINPEDSLILCYYGEILNYLRRYYDSISQFTKAYNIDPEITHILIKKAFTHYELHEYENAQLDLNELMQLDSSNSLVYFYKGLIYYALGNNEKTKIEVEKCVLLFDSNDNLAIFLSRYFDDKTFNSGNILYKYLMQEYLDTKLWSFIYDYHIIRDDNLSKLGIINKFYNVMYKRKGIYFLSNLVSLNSEFIRFQEMDSNSLSGHVLSFEDEVIPIVLPELKYNSHEYYYYCLKLNVKKILNKDFSVEFIFKHLKEIHLLKYEQLSALIGLGWVEYTLPFHLYNPSQLSINLKNNSIIMQIDYVRMKWDIGNEIDIPEMDNPFQIYNSCPNIPEIFNDKYFSKKEMENLIELKDIIY
ncbi:4835_t:CDS:2 [Funneliformis caledonium]|uniref:4835_t:CDS:1 n=1 Tax=Funneliformis caledonium TaxID=1117310 RepID=A0A9N8YPJ9_9GLOM|nr:4835_t:CDS:2 [Funneliformis caledonium]